MRRPCTDVVAEVSVGWTGLQAKGVLVWTRLKDVGRGWTTLLLAASPRGSAGRRPAVAMSTLSPALAMEGGRGWGVGSCTVAAVGGWEDERRQRTPQASPALRIRQFSRLLLLQAAWPHAALKPRQAWGCGDAPGPWEKPAQVSAAGPLGAARGRVLFWPQGRDSVQEQGRQTPLTGSQRCPSLCCAPSPQSPHRPLFSASQRLSGP